MPEHASQLYARNVQALLELLLGEDGDAEPGLRGRDHRGRVRDARRRDRPRGSEEDRGGRSRLMIPSPSRFSSRTWRSSCSPASSGFLVISKVPNTLHTPLMRGTNAIHGIVVLGGMHRARPRGRRQVQQAPARHRDRLRHDQRRRRLPRDRPHARDVQEQAEASRSRRRGDAGSDPPLATSFLQDENFIAVLYIVAFALFIYGPDGADRPEDRGARQPDRRGRHGDRGGRDAARPGDAATGA